MKPVAFRSVGAFFHSVIAIAAISAVAIFVAAAQVGAQEESVEPAPVVEEVVPADDAAAAEEGDFSGEETQPELPPEVTEAIEESVAEESAPEEVAEDITVTPEELGVSDPSILPDNPLYVFKRFGRGVRRFFTRGSAERADEDMRAATQKLIEAKKLAENRGEEAKELIDRTLGEAQEDMRRLAEEARKTDQGSEQESDDLLDKVTDRTFKTRRFLDELGEKVENEDLRKAFEGHKDKAFDTIAGIMADTEDPDELGVRLVEAGEAQRGSAFKHFKNLEVLKDLEDRVPERARDAIRQAQENALRRLKENVEGSPIQLRETFDEYIEHLPGEASAQFEILDDLRTETEVAPEFRAQIDAMKSSAAQKFRAQFEERKELREKMLDSFRDGELKDLRVLEQLRGQLPPEVSGQLREAQEESIQKFRDRFADDPNAIEVADLVRKATENPDAVDFALMKTLRERFSPDQQDFIRNLEEQGARRVGDEFRARGEEFSNEFADPNAPQALEVLESLRGRLPEEAQQGMERAIEAHRTRFEEHVRRIDDPRVLKHFEQAIEADAGLRESFEKGDPEFFKKIENRREDLERGRMEKRREFEDRVRPLLNDSELPVPSDLPEELREKLEQFRQGNEGLAPRPFREPEADERRARPAPFGEHEDRGEKPMPPAGVRPEERGSEERDEGPLRPLFERMERRAPDTTNEPREEFREETREEAREEIRTEERHEGPLPFGEKPAEPRTSSPELLPVPRPEGIFQPQPFAPPPAESRTEQKPFEPPPEQPRESSDSFRSEPPPPSGEEPRLSSFLGSFLAMLESF